VSELLSALKRLGSAEEFLSFFRIAFDQRVVDVYRLRILKQANAFLRQQDVSEARDDELYEDFRRFLNGVYQDFAAFNGAGPVRSEDESRAAHALQRPTSAFVPLEDVLRLKRPKGS
jgi:nitrogenase-stabilizing/protective protein